MLAQGTVQYIWEIGHFRTMVWFCMYVVNLFKGLYADSEVTVQYKQ